jgi:hypothetical protein
VGNPLGNGFVGKSVGNWEGTQLEMGSCLGNLGRAWGSRWGTGKGAVPPVPAEGGTVPTHHHGGEFFGHGFDVVVVGPGGTFLGRGQVAQDRGAEAVKIDPGAHGATSTGTADAASVGAETPIAGSAASRIARAHRCTVMAVAKI